MTRLCRSGRGDRDRDRESDRDSRDVWDRERERSDRDWGRDSRDRERDSAPLQMQMSMPGAPLPWGGGHGRIDGGLLQERARRFVCAVGQTLSMLGARLAGRR